MLCLGGRSLAGGCCAERKASSAVCCGVVLVLVSPGLAPAHSPAVVAQEALSTSDLCAVVGSDTPSSRVGKWLRVAREMFRLAEWVQDPHDDLACWTLWSRGRGVVSHETALTVYGIGEFESARVHLTVPPGFTRRDASR